MIVVYGFLFVSEKAGWLYDLLKFAVFICKILNTASLPFHEIYCVFVQRVITLETRHLNLFDDDCKRRVYQNGIFHDPQVRGYFARA